MHLEVQFVRTAQMKKLTPESEVIRSFLMVMMKHALTSIYNQSYSEFEFGTNTFTFTLLPQACDITSRVCVC